jgi:hypothetical protein
VRRDTLVGIGLADLRRMHADGRRAADATSSDS